MSSGQKLVIVESPAKAKTIAKYLGDDFRVLASVGHIRDLIDLKDLPPELKKQGTIGKFSIDVEDDFKPYYAISAGKNKTVSELKAALKDADELYLATDEDREGRGYCLAPARCFEAKGSSSPHGFPRNYERSHSGSCC